jgi:hypothetical protein
MRVGCHISGSHSPTPSLGGNGAAGGVIPTACRKDARPAPVECPGAAKGADGPRRREAARRGPGPDAPNQFSNCRANQKGVRPMESPGSGPTPEGRHALGQPSSLSAVPPVPLAQLPGRPMCPGWPGLLSAHGGWPDPCLCTGLSFPTPPGLRPRRAFPERDISRRARHLPRYTPPRPSPPGPLAGRAPHRRMTDG